MRALLCTHERYTAHSARGAERKGSPTKASPYGRSGPYDERDDNECGDHQGAGDDHHIANIVAGDTPANPVLVAFGDDRNFVVRHWRLLVATLASRSLDGSG